MNSPSLEITVGGAPKLAALAHLVPRTSTVNVAFVEEVPLQMRLDAISVLHQAGIRPRPILSARRIPSPEFLQDLSAHLVQLNLDAVFVVGGDPSTPAGPYSTAQQLLSSETFATFPLRQVGLAGYPDQHPTLNQAQLLESLQHKVELIQDQGRNVEITTQLCLDANAIVTWVNKARAAGITAPLRLGIPVPCSPKALLNFCRICRIEADHSTLLEYGWINQEDDEIAVPDAMISTLNQADLGPNVHTHIYPIGNIEKSLTWLNSMDSF